MGYMPLVWFCYSYRCKNLRKSRPLQLRRTNVGTRAPKFLTPTPRDETRKVLLHGGLLLGTLSSTYCFPLSFVLRSSFCIFTSPEETVTQFYFDLSISTTIFSRFPLLSSAWFRFLLFTANLEQCNITCSGSSVKQPHPEQSGESFISNWVMWPC